MAYSRLLIAAIFCALWAGANAFIIALEEVDTLFPHPPFAQSPWLARRQEIGSNCAVGEHSCLAVNVTGCCPNDHYCYVNGSGTAKCCADGSRCDDPCPISQYHCTVSSTTSCCPRPCPAPSGFQCPQSFGGNCCSVGSVCLTDNRCSPTVNPATINTVSASPTGCTNGQYSCPKSLGGGCCQSGLVCTEIGSKLFCAGTATATTASRTGASTAAASKQPSQRSGSLSTGGKIGIGIGVSFGAIILLTAFVCFIAARRRPGNDANSKRTSKLDTTNQSSMPPRGNQNGSKRTDYFGPVAQAGPFTNHGSYGESNMTAYEYHHQGAVPVSPERPGDIKTPVELASSPIPSPDDSLNSQRKFG